MPVEPSRRITEFRSATLTECALADGSACIRTATLIDLVENADLHGSAMASALPRQRV